MTFDSTQMMEPSNVSRTGNLTSTNETVEAYIVYILPTVVLVPMLGLPTNALVIRFLLGKPGICSTSEIFTLNLALFDTLFCIMVIVEYIRLLLVYTMESASFLAWGLNQAGGSLLLCMMSLDSYVAICHPLVFLQLKDPKLRLSLSVTMSVVTVGCCALVKLRAAFKWRVILVLLCCAMVIISTCSFLILRSLHQAGPNKKEVHPVKKRAFKVVLTAFVLINIHYIPPVFEYGLREFGPQAFKPYSVITCVACLALSMSCFTQPLSYLIRTKQLPKMRCCCSATSR